MVLVLFWHSVGIILVQLKCGFCMVFVWCLYGVCIVLVWF